MPQARLELDEYTIRVLDVIKGKFGLKNRSEALNRFAKEYGGEFVKFPLDERYLKELDASYEEHLKKHGLKNMTEEELDRLLGL